MATIWNFKAVGTPVFQADIRGFQGGLTLPLPANTVKNDDLFAFISYRDPTPASLNAPADTSWKLVANYSTGTKLYAKKAGDSEPSFNISGDSVVGNAGGVIVSYTGGSGNYTPINYYTKYNNPGITDCPTDALSVSREYSLVLTFGAVNWNTITSGINSWPGGATTRLTAGSNQGSNEMGLIIGDILQTTPTNIASGSIDYVTTDNLKSCLIVAAFEPASSVKNKISGGTPNTKNRGFGNAVIW